MGNDKPEGLKGKEQAPAVVPALAPVASTVKPDVAKEGAPALKEVAPIQPKAAEVQQKSTTARQKLQFDASDSLRKQVENEFKGAKDSVEKLLNIISIDGFVLSPKPYPKNSKEFQVAKEEMSKALIEHWSAAGKNFASLPDDIGVKNVKNDKFNEGFAKMYVIDFSNDLVNKYNERQAFYTDYLKDKPHLAVEYSIVGNKNSFDIKFGPAELENAYQTKLAEDAKVKEVDAQKKKAEQPIKDRIEELKKRPIVGSLLGFLCGKDEKKWEAAATGESIIAAMIIGLFAPKNDKDRLQYEAIRDTLPQSLRGIFAGLEAKANDPKTKVTMAKIDRFSKMATHTFIQPGRFVDFIKDPKNLTKPLYIDGPITIGEGKGIASLKVGKGTIVLAPGSKISINDKPYNKVKADESTEIPTYNGDKISGVLTQGTILRGEDEKSAPVISLMPEKEEKKPVLPPVSTVKPTRAS